MQKIQIDSTGILIDILELIKAGKYDKVDWKVNEKVFPFKERNIGLWAVDSLTTESPMTFEELRVFSYENRPIGFIDAESEHLLKFAAEFPDLLYGNSFVGLGSVEKLDNQKHMLRIYGIKRENEEFKYRFCNCEPVEKEYKAGTKILIVRKLS